MLSLFRTGSTSRFKTSRVHQQNPPKKKVANNIRNAHAYHSTQRNRVAPITARAVSLAEKVRRGEYATSNIYPIAISKRFFYSQPTYPENLTQSAPNIVGKTIQNGIDNFGDLVRQGAAVIDKTLMIKEFWEGQNCVLITRPRRFGKSLNLSTLEHFFAKKVNGVETKDLFQDFAIAQADGGEFMKNHQGKYPVISISFKDVKDPSFEGVIKIFRNEISKLYGQHKYLLSSTKIDQDDQKKFHIYLEEKADDKKLQKALQFLSELLYKAHDNTKVIILIDEYDAPLTMAYEHKFSDELGNFMRNMLSSALKSNPYVRKSLMTGVLRVSQSSMLSGLNNLTTYTVLNPNYRDYFGFEEPEVEVLLKRNGFVQPGDAGVFAAVKALYNGYKIGGVILYNPWSIMQFICQKELRPYWVLTANDVLLKKVLLNASDETKDKLSKLMLGETIECMIDTNLRYEDLMERPDAIWTLLLFGGYLTVESHEFDGSLAQQVKEINLDELSTQSRCQVRIPNKEVLAQYKDIFAGWLKEQIGVEKYNHFLRKLSDKDIVGFTKELNEFIQRTLSIRDVHGKKARPEYFYHGMMVGLIASLLSDYMIKSNRESGSGFYDITLIPRSAKTRDTAIIMECKRAKTNEQLKGMAKDAVVQIKKRHYAAELKEYPGVKRVLMLGLAFNDKAVASDFAEIELNKRM